jgi:hypothetical protein
MSNQADSFVPVGFLDTRTAFERVGRVVFRAEFTALDAAHAHLRAQMEREMGRETGQTKVDWNSFPSIFDTPIGSINERSRIAAERRALLAKSARLFRRVAHKGWIAGHLVGDDGSLTKLPGQAWAAVSFAQWPNPDTVTWQDAITGRQDRGRTIFRAKDIDRFLRKWEAPRADSHPKQSRSSSSIATETKAVEIIARLANEYPRLTRKETWREVEKQLGTKLGWRSFNRAWKQSAPPAWKKPGSLPRNRSNNPNSNRST